MSYGISILSIIPGRKEPSDKNEQITQVLFGEHYKVLEEQSKWLRISLTHDNYECWIDRKQHLAISDNEFEFLQNSEVPRTLDLLGIAKDKNTNSYYNIPLGSRLPFFEDGKFRLDACDFDFKGNLAINDHDNLMGYAHLFLNAPYLWGGRTPFGIDCSGFSQMAYLLIGIQIPRDAYQQAEIGEVIDFKDVKTGDLAFFANDSGNIHHVGIITSPNYIIHASGKVRLDLFDETGILVEQTGEYSHSLHSIRRIFD